MREYMRGNKGFSLVELIIVVAIMAVLMGVLAPQYLRYVEKAKIRTDDLVVEAIYDAAMSSLMSPTFHNKVETFPVIKILEGGIVEIEGMVSTVPDANELLKKDIYITAYGVETEDEIENPFKSKAFQNALSNGGSIDITYSYDTEFFTFGLQISNAPAGSRFYSE